MNITFVNLGDVLLGFAMAVSYSIVCVKTFGWRLFARLVAPLDIAFTIIVPILLGTTLGGAAAAIYGGLIFSIITIPLLWFRET